MDKQMKTNFFKQQRIKVGLTQKNIADQLNISYQSVSKWELGKAFPRSEYYRALSEILQCSVDDIVNASEQGAKTRVDRRINLTIETLKTLICRDLTDEEQKVLNNVFSGNTLLSKDSAMNLKCVVSITEAEERTFRMLREKNMYYPITEFLGTRYGLDPEVIAETEKFNDSVDTKVNNSINSEENKAANIKETEEKGMFILGKEVKIKSKFKKNAKKEIHQELGYYTAEKAAVIFANRRKNDNTDMILTKNIRMSTDCKVSGKNNNILIIGGSGSGKSYYFLKPNIKNLDKNMVIVDVESELYKATKDDLIKKGYEVDILDLAHPEKSTVTYNPLRHIHSYKDICELVDIIIKSTNSERQGDPFWEDAESTLLKVVFNYLHLYEHKINQTLGYAVKLINDFGAVISENATENNLAADMIAKINQVKDLDIGVDNKSISEDECILVRNYQSLMCGPTKILNSVIIGVLCRLSCLDAINVNELLFSDTINIDDFDTNKKVLFISLSMRDDFLNFVSDMLLTQIMSERYYIIDKMKEENKTKDEIDNIRDIFFMLDEFANNIGYIPDFGKKMGKNQTYNMHQVICLHCLPQLKALYKDNWEVIIGCCDTLLYLSSRDMETLEFVSKACGFMTVSPISRKKTRSADTICCNEMIRPVMTPDELMRVHSEDCLCFIRGELPIFDKKYISEIK